MTEEAKKYHREYSKKRREKMVAEKRCIVCGEPVQFLCQRCPKHQALKQEWDRRASGKKRVKRVQAWRDGFYWRKKNFVPRGTKECETTPKV
jgi:hypothetical protein